MKGNANIIDALNSVLTKELTAINQYFLHARMMQDWGLEKIGKLEYKASIDEMKHADDLIKRILFLEGLPNVQKLEKVRIGQNIKEMFECDLKVEYEAMENLKNCIELAEKERDYVSRRLFNDILDSEEEHIDWLETQLGLLGRVGEQNYQQTQIEMGE
ncbi:MAG: bacterioferritin [Deltaproteobacteria bacterium]|nr:MAG: bacterioferritin [Deltaproteobacteria bacterium]